MLIAGIGRRKKKDGTPYFVVHAIGDIPAGQGVGEMTEESGFVSTEVMTAALNGQKLEDVVGAHVVFDRNRTGYLRSIIIQKVAK